MGQLRFKIPTSSTCFTFSLIFWIALSCCSSYFHCWSFFYNGRNSWHNWAVFGMKRISWFTAPKYDLSSFKFFGVNFSVSAFTFELIVFSLIEIVYTPTIESVFSAARLHFFYINWLFALSNLFKTCLTTYIQNVFPLILLSQSVCRLARRVYVEGFPIPDP